MEGNLRVSIVDHCISMEMDHGSCPLTSKLKFDVHSQMLKITIWENLIVCFISTRLTNIQLQKYVVFNMLASYSF